MWDDDRERGFHRRRAKSRQSNWWTHVTVLLAALALSTDLAAGTLESAMTAGSGALAGKIEFETVSGAPVWPIPAVGGTTVVPLGLRVTNRSETSLRFTDFDTLRPALRDVNGKAISIDGGRDRTLPPDVKNCPLLAPGDSVLFSLDAALHWYDGILRLGGSDGFGGLWYFAGLKPGTYEFSIGYSQNSNQLVLGTPEALALRQFWIGEAAGSSVSVTITQP